MSKVFRYTVTALFIATIAIFISSPAIYMNSFLNGLTVWAYNVLPALFPFMVITTLAVKLLPQSKFSVTRRLFKIDCDAVLLSSLLCGYPVGAKAIADSSADTVEAASLASFCSSASPIFMIATVGGKLLQNTAATFALLLSQISASIINGIIYRPKTKSIKKVTFNQTLSVNDLGETITNSALSVISVGGLISLFYMLSDMLKSLLPIAIQSSLTVNFLLGLFEMTNGIIGICQNSPDLITSATLCSGLLAFGGMCVFMQCMAYLAKKKIPVITLLRMKATQSAIAALICYIICLVIM